jgi:hypothetical protein
VGRAAHGDGSAPDWRRIAVEPLCGVDDALAGVAGRAAQAEFGPGIKVSNCIDDAPAQFAIDWAGAVAAMLFQRAGGQADMDSSVGRPQETGYDGRGSGIHEQPPARIDDGGGLPLIIGSYGEGGSAGGSDRFRRVTIVTPPNHIRRDGAACDIHNLPFGVFRRSVEAYDDVH